MGSWYARVGMVGLIALCLALGSGCTGGDGDDTGMTSFTLAAECVSYCNLACRRFAECQFIRPVEVTECSLECQNTITAERTATGAKCQETAARGASAT